MKRTLLIAFALGMLAATAMPTKEELAKAKILVGEAMKLPVERFKKGRISAEEVAYCASQYAVAAKLPEEKFLLLRGAVNYYARAKLYDDAADVIEKALLGRFDDIPGEALYEITSNAVKNVTEKAVPRLFRLNALAQKLMDAEQKLAANNADAALKRTRAEILVALKGESAIGEFASLGGDFAKMAVPDPSGSPHSASNPAEFRDEFAKNMMAFMSNIAERADFWWDYKCTEPEAEDAIRRYAVKCYSGAVGKLQGEKKALAVKRMNEYGFLTNEQKRAKELDETQISGTKAEKTKKLMEAIRLSHISFKPPQTIADAIEYFNKVSKENDVRTNVPDGQRGVKIVLKTTPSDGNPTIPMLSATDITLYESVKLVSQAVGFKMRIDGDTVVIYR